MLVEFAVSNFRSFGDEQRLILEATRDQLLPDNVTSTGAIAGRNPLRLLKLVVLYGANASGKSNLHKAISVFCTTVKNSATRLSEGDELPSISPFRLDPDLEKRPSRFESVAYLEGNLWRYGFAATRTKINEEWLYVTKPNGPETPWFHRDGDKKDEWHFGSSLRGRQRSLCEETRPGNYLVLSTAARIGVDALRPLYQWIRRGLRTFDFSSPTAILSVQTTRWCREDEHACHAITALLQASDFGITEMQIENVDQERPNLPFRDTPEERTIRQAMELIASLGTGKVDRPATYHQGSSVVDPVRFSIDDESNGTQRMFAIAGPLLKALREGQTLVIDEIDCSLHPALLRELLEIVQDPGVNRSGCQLIVTTHDTTLQDPELLRRDQIWLTEKNARGMTEIYSTYDIDRRPRADAPISREYLNGRYGGVPVFGNLRRAFLSAVDAELEEKAVS